MVFRQQEHGHYEILISHVQVGDAGVYKAVAMNKWGTAECEAEMAIAGMI